MRANERTGPRMSRIEVKSFASRENYSGHERVNYFLPGRLIGGIGERSYETSQDRSQLFFVSFSHRNRRAPDSLDRFHMKMIVFMRTQHFRFIAASVRSLAPRRSRLLHPAVIHARRRSRFRVISPAET